MAWGDDWPTEEEIYNRLIELASTTGYKDYCRVFDFVTDGSGKGGPTQGTEGPRKSNYVRIGLQDAPTGPRSTVVIIAGVHAREWAPPTLVTNLVQRLLEARKTNAPLSIGGAGCTKEQVKDIIDKVDLYIAPMINPDGYAWTQSAPENRFWRKNRRPPPSPMPPHDPPTCSAADPDSIGVDINRNFDVIWDFKTTFAAGSRGGMSDRPCHFEKYVGRARASERETQNVVFLMSKNPQYFVDVHMTGRKIYHAWGTDENEEISGPTPALQTSTPRDFPGGSTKDKINKDFVKECRDVIANLMADATGLAGTRFDVIQGSDLGAFSGATDDFATNRNLPTVPGGLQPIRAFTIECGVDFDDDFSAEFQATEKEVQAALVALLVYATTTNGLKAALPVPGSGTTAPPKSCSNC